MEQGEWVEQELEFANLEDERLNDRLRRVLSLLAKSPTRSIPSACCAHAETKAAYRFFSNEKVSFETVLESHVESSKARVTEHPVVLLVQDSTEIELTRPKQQVNGAGYLSDDRRGVLLHMQQAFTPEGTPLGTISAELICRGKKKKYSKKGKYKQLPIEQKESNRWLCGMRVAQEISEEFPKTQCINIADSESDIYEVLCESALVDKRVDWIVRACQNRKLADQETGENLLYDAALKAPVIFEKSLDIRGKDDKKFLCEKRRRKQPRKARCSKAKVHATRVTLNPPYRKEQRLPAVEINVVLVKEENPPETEAPIEWLLLTTLPIGNKEQVAKVIEYYCTRWMIEIFFKTLKSGCHIEQRLFEEIDNFEPCLAIYLIVAWRALYICRVARSYPNLSCQLVFEPSEWKAVYMITLRKRPPKKPPSLESMLLMVAQLGGYVVRKNSLPGPMTTWLGLQRTYDLALAWDTFGPEARAK